MENALYMNDSYLKEFEAVVESVKDDKFVVLDKTAFYPTGGGQPYDTRSEEHTSELQSPILISRMPSSA